MDFLSAAGGRSSYGRVAFKEGDTGDDTPLALHTSSDSTSDGKAIASVEGHPLSHQEKLDMLCEADPEGIKENISDNKSWYCGNFINILMINFETEHIAVLPGNTRFERDEIGQEQKRFVFIPFNVDYQGRGEFR